MSYISESSGGFVCAGRDGKIYIRTLGEDKKEMPLNLFKTYKFGEEYKISRVAYENGTESFKFGDETRNTLWLNQENLFIVEEEQVQNIYNKLEGLVINSFEGTSIIDPTIDMGDMLIIGGKPIIYQGQMSLSGRFIADIKSKMSIKQRQETTTKRTSQKLVNRKVQSRIDEVEGKITQLVQEQDKTSQKLSKHEQTIDSISDAVSSVETKLENDYSTTVEMNSLIDQRANSITSTVTEIAKEEASSSANSAVNSKLSNYYTKTQTDSRISQTASSITSEVNKKVGNDEWSTKIQQSYSDIQIAWNKISSYIQFISASLRIMDSSSKKLLQLDRYGLYLYDTDGSTNKMILSRAGQQFYESGDYVGKIGTNQLHGYPDKKDLTFDLDTRGSFMDWACRDNAGDSNYSMKLWYARPNTGTLHEGLCLGTELHLNNYNVDCRGWIIHN